jgi:hypothetical protein
MKKIDIGKVLYGLGIIIPFCYIALGCTLLFTGIFPNLDGWKKYTFGIIIILYGAFRLYRQYLKLRNRDEE